MGNVQNYAVQGPNSTAVNILRTWLGAVGVPVRLSDVPGCDLTVGNADGTERQVQVRIGNAPQLAQDVLVVEASAFTGKKLARALEAFWSVTDACGYERQQPVDRGAEPELNEVTGNPKKLHYKDAAFDVIIRHTEFRRSVNPPSDRWKQYKSTMEKVCWSFLRLNHDLCQRHGLNIDDLMQYARCYVVNFCTRYEIPNPVHFDNERKCYRYLQQRFASDLRPILLKMERSTLPDAETVALALYGSPNADLECSPDADEEEVDYDYIARNCELDTSSVAARKASAAEKLAELLQAMPHDQMVDVLKVTSENHGDFTTRKEAARQLRAHQAACDSCEVTPVAETEIEEELNQTMPEAREKAMAFYSDRVPQADLLPTVRKVVEAAQRGLSTKDELSEALGISTRTARFYRIAAETLGLVTESGRTELGKALTGTIEASDEEADVFRQAMFESPVLRVFAWFFEDETTTAQDLAAFMSEQFDLGMSACARRSTALRAWRKYLTR